MEYKKITSERYDDVIQHLRATFFADEPLNKAADLCQRGEGNEELEQHSISTLEDELSIMAVSENDEIAGVILNGILRSGDVEKSREKLDECQDDSFKKIFNLLYGQNINVNFFLRFGVDKVFDIRILSVDPRFRGQGIAKKLLKESEKFARENNFKVMKADATGIFSQKVVASEGFETISEVVYKDYKDENGFTILDVDPPHDKLKIMFKVLQ